MTREYNQFGLEINTSKPICRDCTRCADETIVRFSVGDRVRVIREGDLLFGKEGVVIDNGFMPQECKPRSVVVDFGDIVVPGWEKHSWRRSVQSCKDLQKL